MQQAASRPRLTFAVLTVGATAFALLQSLVVPVLPTLQKSLHTSQASITWVLTAYLLSAAVATPVLGRMGDVLGKERVFIACLLAVFVGSLVCAIATSLAVMVTGRAIQGIGGAVYPLAFGIIRDEFPKERVAGAIGAIASLLAAATALGLVIAGPITDGLGYHWLFWAPLPFIAGGAVAGWLWIPESPVRSHERPNIAGGILLTAWLLTLLLGVSQGRPWGWTDARVLGLFVSSAVLAVAWVLVEQRVKQPLVDIALMRQPAVLRTNIVGFLFGAVVYSAFFLVPQFLQAPRGAGYGFHTSVTKSGLYFLPMAVFSFLAGQSAGRLTKVWGSRAVTIAGATLTTLGLLQLTIWHDQLWQIPLAMTVYGLGVGYGYAAMTNLVVESVPPHQTGVAAGVNTNIRTIGGAIGGQTVGVLVASGAASGAVPPESGYIKGFAVLTVASAVSIVAAVAVPVRRAFAAEAAGPGEADAVLVRECARQDSNLQPSDP